MVIVQAAVTAMVLAATAFAGAWVAEDMFPEADVIPYVGVGGAATFVVSFLVTILALIWS